MSKTTSIPYLQTVNNLDGVITNATGSGTTVAVFTAGANDAVLKSFGLSNTDTSAITVNIYVNFGAADRLIGTVIVPADAGNNGTTATVDVLRNAMLPWLSYDAYGNRVFNLKAGSIIKIAAVAAPASGKQIAAFGEGGDF